MAEITRYCTECGEPLTARQKKCKKCGTLVATKSSAKDTAVEVATEEKPIEAAEIVAAETVSEETVNAAETAVAVAEKEVTPELIETTEEASLEPASEQKRDSKGLLEEKNSEIKSVETDPAPSRKSRYAPVSTFGFFLMYILLLIPIVNIVLLFVWARKGSKKINRRNFARAALIFLLIMVIWAVVSYFFGQAIYGGLVTKYAGFLQGIGLDSLVQLWGNV